MNSSKLPTLVSAAFTLVLLLGLAPHSGLPAAEVETNAGKQIVGELLELTTQSLTLSTDAGNAEIPLNQVRSIEFADSTAATSATSRTWIHLLDDSSFSVDSLTLAGSQLVATRNARSYSIPTAKTLSVRLQMLTDQQLERWRTVEDSRIAADTLVVIRSADSLDKLEGLISSIDSEKVEFEFDGQVVPAPVAKLAGVRFYIPSPSPNAKALGVVTARDGSTWHIASITKPAGTEEFELGLRGGLSLSLPLAEIANIDFSTGSLKYLGDMEPISAGSEPRMHLKTSIEGAEMLFSPRAGSDGGSERGSENVLRFTGKSSAVYRVPEGFVRLKGEVSLAPAGSVTTPCTATITVEKQVVWQSRLEQPRARESFDIEVTADDRIELSIEPHSAFPIGDTVLWHSTRLER